MKKRVCMLLTDALSFNVLCRGQLEYFRDNYDVDLTLICGGTDEAIDALRQRNVGEVVFLPFCRQPSPFRDLWCLIRLFFFFLFNRFDVVVYSTPKAMLLGALSSFLSFQKKRVSVVRGRAYESFEGFKRKAYIFLDKIIVCLSTENLVISRSLKASYVKDGFDSDDFVVLGAGSSNGIDLTRFSNARRSENVGKKFTVGVVGRICKDKGIEQVEEVVNRVMSERSSVHFLLIGSIEDDIGKASVERMVEQGIAVHIPFTNSIQDVFMSLDLHLFLSHREGFGNVAIEAAACAVPTFAFDVVGVRDSVKDGVSGLLFDFLGSSQVCNAIIDAANNPVDFRNRFSKSREWVSDNFEKEYVWQKYLDFYVK